VGVNFSDKAWEEYSEWQARDIKTIKKINALIKSIQRDGLSKGLGHPEALKWENGYSREIDKKNRLLYEGTGNGDFEIKSCKGHYGDK